MGQRTVRTEIVPTDEQRTGTIRSLNIGEDVLASLRDLGAFEGDFFAAPTGAERTALDRRALLADNIARFNPGGDITELGRATARGDFLDPASNPGLAGVIEATLRPLNEQFNEIVLPGIETAATGSGAFDNLRRGLVETEAAENLQDTSGDILSRLIFGNFAQERQLQQNAGNLIQQGLSLQDLPNQLLQSTGTDSRNLEQILLNNALAQFQSDQQFALAPLQALPAFQTAVSSPGGTEIRPGVSPLAGALSGGLGAISGIASAFDTTNPLALGPIGLLGALAGAFG